VMAARFPAAQLASVRDVAFVVVHAKEPKSAPAAKVLGAFMASLAKAVATDASKIAIMSDTNLNSADLARAFADRLQTDGYEARPLPEVLTTAKQRSILHGQCYDTKKCLKLVTAPKDKIISAAGALSGASTYPLVSELGGAGLPSDTWASDHCLAYALLALPNNGMAPPPLPDGSHAPPPLPSAGLAPTGNAAPPPPPGALSSGTVKVRIDDKPTGGCCVIS